MKSPKAGPNLLCRVANATPEKVVEFVSLLPKEYMSNDAFRKKMGKAWFQNIHQAPEQWGLYYLDETGYYPRFNRNISLSEAEDYLKIWIKNYPVINPYTKFKFSCDLPLVDSIIKYLKENPNEHDLKNIIRKIIGFDVPFVLNEIIVNAINNYSGKLITKTISKADEIFEVYLNPEYSDHKTNKVYMNKAEFFHLFDNTNNASNEEPLQIIYFGAPGTGKSYEIKKEVKGKPHFRTTFHPDTDYASFVGSYKPITKPVTRYDIYSNPIIGSDGKPVTEDRIVYRYVFQAFLKAYIAAWEEQTKEQPEDVYLIIEEINRGNCAQIFGDIFQLLDRNDEGFSDYPIVADDDLKQELSQVLGSLDIANADVINSLYPGQGDIVEQIKSGHILLLPNNLFIRATMNTSDQSLFPIDSAFKRRWDWRYVNIKNHEEENYVISFANGNKYSWWDFLTEINNRIEGGEIQQEDKKLGYFFAKAKNGEISAETFLSKVIFFLYNDVFKDFGLEQDFFKDEKGETMTFASYFDHRGQIIESKVEKFLNNLGINPIIFSEEEEMKQDKLESLHDDSKDLRSRKLTIRFKDGEIIQENTRFESFRKALEKIGLDKAEQITSEKEYVRLNSPFVTKEPTPEIEDAPDYSYVQSGEYFILKGANTRTLRNVLNIISDRLDLGLIITVE